jgi:hypothetical protein
MRISENGDGTLASTSDTKKNVSTCRSLQRDRHQQLERLRFGDRLELDDAWDAIDRDAGVHDPVEVGVEVHCDVAAAADGGRERPAGVREFDWRGKRAEWQPNSVGGLRSFASPMPVGEFYWPGSPAV